MQIIKQDGSILHIYFENPINKIEKLYIKNEFNSLTLEKTNGDLHFKIDLVEVAKQFIQYENKKIYIIVEESTPILTTQSNLKVTNSQSEVSGLTEVLIDDSENIKIQPYITRNGYLHLSLDDVDLNKTYFSRRHIDTLKINNSEAIIEGQFATLNSTLKDVQLLIKTRLTDREKFVNINLEEIGKTKNASTYNFSVDIYKDLIEFMKYEYKNEDIIDIYLSIKVLESSENLRIKIGNPRIMAEKLLKGEIITEFNGNIVSLTPYFTMKGRNLSFRINTYDIDSYLTYVDELKRPKRPNFLKKENQKIWVIGEKSYKAQDNGYHFFKYMRTYHPDKPVYYIIEKDSKEAENVLPFGNVIFYNSAEHFKIMIKADYICTTHHPELIYPTTSDIYTRKIKAVKVFLQHGVLGTKNLSNINGNQLKDFNVDLFITSSSREKEIVVRDLNFFSNQVAVTGLARFDELFNPNVEVKNQILIIPTWRDWLTSIDRLQTSEYLKRMNDLLHSQKLKEIANKGTDIIFCLHPNMQPFIDYFDVPSYVTSIKQGDIDVQKLIKESKLMITDYSSVAFDFSFLNKPVIYYQFDRNEFLGKEASHIDIEKELPGIIVNAQDKLERELDNIQKKQFKIDEALEKRIDRFIAYKDRNNCERIFDAITNFRETSKVKSKIKYDILSQHAVNRFRKDKKYFKVMEKFNTGLTRLLPVKKDLIVFESNVGKLVGDSPKFIYDELKKYNKKYQIVWATNTLYPFNDPNVKTVKRLSPEYFYYLSRAKYWINNQNFPHYLRKHKDTIYIQTWHGTPLKKMLNDVETFQGRDANYKNRVNQAIKNWDYLISPSPYASACFKTAFDFKNEILEIGYPRNDVFYNVENTDMTEKKKLIKQKLGIESNKKIILYAPTFRDDEINKAKKHIINLKLDLPRLKESIGDEYILILRPHIIISNALNLSESLNDFVVDGTKYPEISDLYLITDICITDYSSVMFDFANTKKPLLFFTYDLEFYKNKLRGFYFDFEKEAPGPLIKTNDGLIEAIKNITNVQEEYDDKYQVFYNRFCTFEKGIASKTIVDKFFKQDC